MDEMTNQGDNGVMIWLTLFTLPYVERTLAPELPDPQPSWARANGFLV